MTTLDDGCIVMMDNTTIHGAQTAMDRWPTTANDWKADPYAVNLRSLMDVLEAIVLYEKIVLDTACRVARFDEQHSLDPLWEDAYHLIDLRTEARVTADYEYDSDDLVKGAGVLSTAAGKLRDALSTGLLLHCLEDFWSNSAGMVVPRFYRDPGSFVELLRRTFSTEAIDEAGPSIDFLEQALNAASPELANFAMFAFRGFYYEEVATLNSISYSAHSWRSGVIMGSGPTRRPDFAQSALAEMAELREELSRHINDEFDAPALSGRFPLIASFVAGQVGRRSDLLRVALEIRDSQATRAFRDWTWTIQRAVNHESQLKVIRDAQLQLTDLTNDLRRELRLDSRRVASTAITVHLGVPGASLDVPVEVERSLPPWLKRVIVRRPHLKFLRSIAESSLEMAPFALRLSELSS